MSIGVRVVSLNLPLLPEPTETICQHAESSFYTTGNHPLRISECAAHSGTYALAGSLFMVPVMGAFSPFRVCSVVEWGDTASDVVVDISEAMEDSMDNQERRDAAIKRIKDKRDFRTHVVSYVVVNLFLVGVWAVSGGGYFWPGWVMAGWGIGLVLHGWQTYRGDRPITEEDIQREMD